ncbi:DNA-directed RNA polymerase subunit delta [Shouchella shacheensis]|uniref:DNA-directed RNA polymerase subunit delta n=1 Tax=Shouchella shacheensis TaxID=1649580 RepID=UPI001FE0980B|nr:DNA-directed RNA polymerase subunit delta [Shouchella shacheensis]
MSMVETAYVLMKEKRQPYNFFDLLEEVAAVKELSKAQVEERISFLYTDLNIDGRFLTLGDNTWGLKVWYPQEQAEEEITHSAKPAKRRKPANDEDETFDLDGEFEEEDEFEDLEDELDELADEEDQDEGEEVDGEKEDLSDFDDDEEGEEREDD